MPRKTRKIAKECCLGGSEVYEVDLEFAFEFECCVLCVRTNIFLMGE
jgi:hypothetical protein